MRDLKAIEQDRRYAAERAMARFAAEHQMPLAMREEDRGDMICFIGSSPEGREYGIGYMKG